MSELDPVVVSARADRSSLWQVWVDTGGTFTDCVARAPDGCLHRAKVLSNSSVRGQLQACRGARRLRLQVDWNLPDDFFTGASLRPLGEVAEGVEISGYRAAERELELRRAPARPLRVGAAVEILTHVEAPVLGAHWLTRTPLSRPLPSMAMRLATTRGTNALLERRGSPTALFITRGFADLLEIGTQQRPDLFVLAVTKPRPLYDVVVEVDERLDAAGRILRQLDLGALRSQAEAVLSRGVSAAAVALMHSFRNPIHEERVAECLEGMGFRHVSRSSTLAPRIKIVPRTLTAVVNAYLAEVVGSYLERVGESVDPGPLHVLTSAGGLARHRDFLPKDSVLTGPAGGVVGAAGAAVASGFPRSLAFDMGGTSTDVSRYDGTFDYRFETQVGDAQLLSPSLAIETVAAGGGSICHFDGRQLKVGPHSAGASPGPACYGAGGPLTLTDVNLLLGRLEPAGFEIPIDPAAAERAFVDLAGTVEMARGERLADEDLLQGFLDIANERMAEAVRRISIRRGYRAGDHALVAFGGAGGQHACALAEILGIDTVVVPAAAGLLSAVGLGWARIERLAERQVLQGLEEAASRLPELMEDLCRQARAAVVEEGVDGSEVEIRSRMVYLRLVGQEVTLGIEFEDAGSIAPAFLAAYQDHYGYRPTGHAIEVESTRVWAASRGEAAPAPTGEGERRPATPEGERRAHLGGGWRIIPVYQRAALEPGHRFSGPALVFERHCATVVEPGWQAIIDPAGSLVLERRARAQGSDVSGATC